MPPGLGRVTQERRVWTRAHAPYRILPEGRARVRRPCRGRRVAATPHPSPQAPRASPAPQRSGGRCSTMRRSSCASPRTPWPRVRVGDYVWVDPGLHLDVLAQQGGVEHNASWLVSPVSLRDGPTADRGDAQLDAPRRLALVAPDRQQYQYGVPGGHLRNRQITDYGVDVRVEARSSSLPRFRTVP